MKSHIIFTNSLALQIYSKDSKINCMIKVIPEILTVSTDASHTQMSMQSDAGYVARRTVSKDYTTLYDFILINIMINML
jgi:hypothetical protein